MFFGLSNHYGQTKGGGEVVADVATGIWWASQTASLYKYDTTTGAEWVMATISASADIVTILHDKANSRLLLLDIIGNRVVQVDEDGTNEVDVLTSADITSVSTGNWMTIDADNDKFFISCSEGLVSFTLSTFADKNVMVTDVSIPSISGMDWDPITEKVYFCVGSPGGLYSINADGTSVSAKLGTATPTHDLCVADGSVFYAKNTDKVYRADLDGTNAVTWLDAGIGDVNHINRTEDGNITFGQEGGSGVIEGVWIADPTDTPTSTHAAAADYPFDMGTGARTCSAVEYTPAITPTATGQVDGFFFVKVDDTLNYFSKRLGRAYQISNQIGDSSSADFFDIKYDQTRDKLILLASVQNDVWTCDRDGSNAVNVLTTADFGTFSTANSACLDTVNDRLVFTCSEGSVAFDMATWSTKTTLITSATLANQYAIAYDETNDRYYVSNNVNDLWYCDSDGTNQVDASNDLQGAYALAIDNGTGQIYGSKDQDLLYVADLPAGNNNATYLDLGSGDITSLEIDEAGGLIWAFNTSDVDARDGIYEIDISEQPTSTHAQAVDYQILTSVTSNFGFCAYFVQ